MYFFCFAVIIGLVNPAFRNISSGCIYRNQSHRKFMRDGSLFIKLSRSRCFVSYPGSKLGGYFGVYSLEVLWAPLYSSFYGFYVEGLNSIFIFINYCFRNIIKN